MMHSGPTEIPMFKIATFAVTVLCLGLTGCASDRSDDNSESAVVAASSVDGGQDITFEASDGFEIHGTIWPGASAAEGAAEATKPAVILIHQGGSARTEWDFLVPDLLEQNYVVLAYDVRGHGMSGEVESISKLFNDPDLAPRDLQAAIDHLEMRSDVDRDRVAIVGASIGANLACVGIANMGIKTAVAMSGKTEAVHNLAGNTQPTLSSVFYISSMESGGQRAKWAQELYDATAEPRKVEVVEESKTHGVSIFKDSPDLQQSVLDWLGQTL